MRVWKLGFSGWESAVPTPASGAAVTDGLCPIPLGVSWACAFTWGPQTDFLFPRNLPKASKDTINPVLKNRTENTSDCWSAQRVIFVSAKYLSAVYIIRVEIVTVKIMQEIQSPVSWKLLWQLLKAFYLVLSSPSLQIFYIPVWQGMACVFFTVPVLQG